MLIRKGLYLVLLAAVLLCVGCGGKRKYGKYTEEQMQQIGLANKYDLPAPSGNSMVLGVHSETISSDEILAITEETLKPAAAHMDEATFRMLPIITRIWAKKGSKPMIPTHDDKRKVVITGGTDPVSGKTHFYLSESAAQEAALAFVKQIRRRYPDMEIVILLDGAPSHKANILKEYVEQDEKLHLEPLPKYSPKLNIQEDIWKWLRKRITHNFLFDDPKALANAIRNRGSSRYGEKNNDPSI